MFKHYKRDHYYMVTAVAVDSEDFEIMVVYTQYTQLGCLHCYVRPAETFFGVVSDETYCGRRFIPVPVS